jgi:hypothetical protein
MNRFLSPLLLLTACGGNATSPDAGSTSKEAGGHLTRDAGHDASMASPLEDAARNGRHDDAACGPLAPSDVDAGAPNIPRREAGCTQDIECPAGDFCGPARGGAFACGSPTASGATAGNGNGGHSADGGACEPLSHAACDTSALAWSPSIDVSESSTSLVESDTVLAADGKGNVVAAWASLPFPGAPVQQVNRLAVSHDDGATFTDVTTPTDSASSAANDATLAYDASGLFIYVWEAYENNFAGAQHVWLSTSSTGDTWSTPLRVDAPGDSAGAGAALDFPWVATHPINHDLYVSYQSSSNTANGTEHLVILLAGSDGGVRVEGDAGADGGGASTSLPLTDGTRPANYADLARGVFDSSGSFYSAWVELVDSTTEYGGTISGSTENAIYFTRVDHAGSAALAAIPNVKVNAATDAVTFDGPAIAVSGDGSAVYVAYAVGKNNAIDVVVAKSADRGATWSTPVKVNDDAPCATHFHPSLAIDEAGVLYVFWYDNRAGAGHFFYAVSSDTGVTFRTNRLVSAPSFPFDTFQYSTGWLGDYYEPALAGNELYVMWSDGRQGDQSHAFFAKAKLP